jgi:hypothetical protein
VAGAGLAAAAASLNRRSRRAQGSAARQPLRGWCTAAGAARALPYWAASAQPRCRFERSGPMEDQARRGGKDARRARPVHQHLIIRPVARIGGASSGPGWIRSDLGRPDPACCAVFLGHRTTRARQIRQNPSSPARVCASLPHCRCTGRACGSRHSTHSLMTEHFDDHGRPSLPA